MDVSLRRICNSCLRLHISGGQGMYHYLVLCVNIPNIAHELLMKVVKNVYAEIH